MKTLEELKDFYQTELIKDLQLLDAKRRQVMRNMLIAVGVIVVVGLVAFGAITAQGGPPQILFFFLIGGGILAAGVFYLSSKGYKAEFKQQIIRKIITFLEPELTYQPNGIIDKQMFKISGLFNHHIDRYRGEDKVAGTVGKTEIAFSEVHAEYKTTSGTGKNRHTEWHTIFKGLFFIADFNKHFNSQTVVLPDTAEKLFGGFGQILQSWNVARADLVRLEDPEFEREFAVYGSDQIEARYILSPALMRRILDFKKKTGAKLYLSFTGSKVYVALPLTRNLFEPKYFASITDFSHLTEYYHDLSLAVGIVDDLNLNTRIWTKE